MTIRRLTWLMIAALVIPTCTGATQADANEEALKALDSLVAHAEGKVELGKDEVRQAVRTVVRAARSLPADDEVLRPRLERLKEEHAAGAIATPDEPLGTDRPLAQLALGLYALDTKDLPPDQIEAHPSADGFPGAVPEDAPRVSRTIRLDTSVPDWHSTGLYAAPGEVIEVLFPKDALNNDLHVRIGAHNDSLWRHDSWNRCPEICRRDPVNAAVVRAANAFGGPIYIEVPGRCGLGTIELTISNAVEAPHYVHGETDLEQWRSEIRNRPSPWAELETKKVILTLPSEVVRDLDDPEDLMNFWDDVMDACAELAARPCERRRPERYVSDTQISVGYMHSGYPIMTLLDICPVMVKKAELIKNEHGGIWGLFHEMGHNHQKGEWTFGGTGEVTVNLFTLYVFDKACGSPESAIERARSPEATKKIKEYMAGGADFEQWKRDPFLALAMYAQLQEAFGWGAFQSVFSEYRCLPEAKRPKTDDEKRDQWLVRFSRAVGRDLGPFFEAWGVPTSPEARASIAHLPLWMPRSPRPER